MKKKLAFSLLELAFVTVIIGVLIAGIINGANLVRSSRVAAARSLTKSSPVASIKGLTLWVETSGLDEKALTSTTNATKPNDGDFISSWKDINPQSKKKKLISQPGADSRKPNYLEKGINDLPSLKLDVDPSNEDYMLIVDDNTPIKAGDDTYTMFAVWQGDRPSSDFSGTWWLIISQGQNAAGREAGLGIGNTVKLQYAGNSNTYTSPTSEGEYKIGKPYIIAATVNNNTANNIRLFTNGFMSEGATANRTIANITGANFVVGSKSSLPRFIGGLISEIIVYDRNLNLSEVKEINEYLSKKYAIKLDTNF